MIETEFGSPCGLIDDLSSAQNRGFLRSSALVQAQIPAFLAEAHADAEAQAQVQVPQVQVGEVSDVSSNVNMITSL